MEAGASEKWLGSSMNNNGNENESSENLPQTTERSSLTAGSHSSNQYIMDIGHNIPSSAQQDMRQHSNNNDETANDNDGDYGDSDSEIEFLLTILPPSPQKTTLSTTPTQEHASMESNSSSNSNRNARSSDSFAAPQQHQQEESGNRTRSTANDTVSSSYTSTIRPLHSDCHDDPQHQHSQTTRCTNQTMPGTADVNSISNVSPQSSPSNHKLINTSMDDNFDQMVSSAASSDKTQSSSKTAAKSFSSPDHSYSMHRRSAYLQSLAEICHAILWDARWRVGPEQKRLLTWERGDDLAVVCTLAEQYIPINIPKAPPSAGKQVTKQFEETPMIEVGETLPDQSMNVAAGATPTEMETSKQTTVGGYNDMQDSADGGDTANSSAELEEDTHNRRLNLYCRLYYRKGPYFRVDDVFDKYYSPRRNKNESNSTAPSSLPDPNDIATATEKNVELLEQTKKDERRDFFRPQKKKKTEQSVSPNANSCCVDNRNTLEDNTLLDMNMLHRQLDSACDLVKDWRALHDMGFLRTFVGEEECGKTIGTKSGIMKQDEQNQILQLLGCKKKKKSPSDQKKTNSKSPTDSENLVWKQMVHQTTISFAAIPGMTTRRGSVLPVMKHMNTTVLNSWAKSIVLKASKKDYIPTSSLQSLTMAVKAKLVDVIRALTDSGLDIFPCCSRLREPPLNALRRCFRLYLCATSGPGSMRGDDGTAWKSLPESHAKDMTKLPFQQLIPPPGSNCWNKISCPGKDYRFKITSCNFIRAHEPLDLKCDENCTKKYDWKLIQVFPTLEAFSVWELAVEFRANVDYLMMLKDLLRYNERRRLKQQNDEQDGKDNESSASMDLESATVDFYDLLTPNGRATMLRKLCVDMEPGNLGIAAILDNIENDVEKLEAGFAGGETTIKLPVECDKVVAVISIVSLHALAACSVHTSGERLLLYKKRPWLRHLRWEGCLAYILWDTIKTLECKLDGFYGLAVKALDVLLFGRAVMPSELDYNKIQTAKLATLVLSRRAKGKAYERLTLDYLHHLRQQRQKEQQKEDLIMMQEKERRKQMRRAKKRKSKGHVEKHEPTPNEVVANFSQVLVQACVRRAQIPFSAVRTLARRLKRPLTKTLEGIMSPEAVELGHRYSNDSCVSSTACDTRYSDWTPTTDRAVANAMATEDDLVGKRCSYVGFEDTSINIESLNVEELAMEFYRTGRLPAVDNPVQKGGWAGWHDEGGKVRQLWRILSSPGVLGMDFGSIDDAQTLEMATIHLTPYQGAPFDLHCGTELDFDMVVRRGFYERRKHSIDQFLNQIASLKPSQIADLVHSSVETRLLFAREHQDPTLRRDIDQVRSLSLLAAGIGGKLLSAIFRCFFYDYRHYSGGLPDLTLVRVLSQGSIVDLGELVGEGFHPDHQKADNVLEDRDSEFLGCNKVGDSGSRGINQMRRGQRRQERGGHHESEEKLTMPTKLDLTWHGNPVIVECMFVEVKSANDRLDARQEDWLNILDIHGNARVCKFGSKGK